MPVLSAAQWLLAAASALMVGLTKSGLPGLTILIVPMFAHVFPARASTGALLPILVVGDLIAVAFWRRHAAWRQILRLAPWALAGIALGWFAMGHLDDAVARPMIGSLLIAMLAANLLLEVRARRALRAAPAAGAAAPVMPLVTDRWWFAGTCGVAAGFITMMTNAAGAAMTVYLVAMRLPKERFIGTMAWFFLLINCVKVPLSISLGLITAPSLALDAALAGLVVLGSLAGLLVAKRIPQRAFNTVVQLLAAAAATTMFF